MTEFFANMDSSLQIYWYISIVASLIFVVQMVLAFLGTDSDGIDVDMDGDHSGGSSHIFSFRNLINFLLGFGWTGVSLFSVFENKIVLAVLAVLVGMLFVGIFFAVIKVMMKLAEDNTFKIEDTIGKTASVYLTIPASKSGKGKILISIKGSVHELNAITASEKEIKSGDSVKVLAVATDSTLIVEII